MDMQKLDEHCGLCEHRRRDRELLLAQTKERCQP